MAKILCIEDSKEFQIYLKSILREHNLIFAATVQDATRLLESGRGQFGLVLLDVSLPDGNGIKALPQLKEVLGEHVAVPFIIISSDNDTLTKVAAFGVGADDYISKPPDSSELKARVEAKLRWASTQAESQKIITFEDLTLDCERMAVDWLQEGGGRKTIDLTPFEFKILRLLLARPAQVFSRDQIIERVWGSGRYLTPRTVDAHISHLRSKIAETQVRIETVLSAGYKISKRGADSNSGS